jgi:hypothetical protein
MLYSVCSTVYLQETIHSTKAHTSPDSIAETFILISRQSKRSQTPARPDASNQCYVGVDARAWLKIVTNIDLGFSDLMDNVENEKPGTMASSKYALG